MILLVWASDALDVQRVRDLGHSGWWHLIGPVLSLVPAAGQAPRWAVVLALVLAPTDAASHLRARQASWSAKLGAPEAPQALIAPDQPGR
jgi:hypothetical protein